MENKFKDCLILFEFSNQGVHEGLNLFGLTFKDIEGNPKIAMVGCKSNYTEQIEKSLQKLIAISIPKEKIIIETAEEDCVPVAPSELPTGKESSDTPE